MKCPVCGERAVASPDDGAVYYCPECGWDELSPPIDPEPYVLVMLGGGYSETRFAEKTPYGYKTAFMPREGYAQDEEDYS